MTAYHITLLSETNDAFIVATQTQMSVVLSETKKAGVIKVCLFTICKLGVSSGEMTSGEMTGCRK